MRSMCGMKLVDKKLTKDLMHMLDLNKTIDQLAKANSVRWYGHVLRKDKNNFPRKALYLRVKWTRKRGRPKTNNRSRWRLGINTISDRMR